jgi:hypothetical protein
LRSSRLARIDPGLLARSGPPAFKLIHSREVGLRHGSRELMSMA